MTQPPTVVQCPEHPDISTGLRCSRCERPICPRCLVQTPVGARCRACARLQRLPIFTVGPGRYARAAAAGAGTAVVAGLIWGMAPFGGFISFFLSPLAGYFVGEAVSRAAGRRRSVGLKVVAALGAVLAYVVAQTVVPLLDLGPAAIASGAGGAVLAFWVRSLVGVVLNPFAWLIMALGAFIATTRIE